MTLKEKYERFDDFKADIWKWKSDNREEYNRFAQMMTGCDEQGLFLFYRAVASQMPQLIRQWELAYNDDTCPDKFAEIDVLFKEQAVPQQIVEQYGRERNATCTETATPSLWQRIRMLFGWRPQPCVRISAPLVLSWLFFGRSFETMVLMLEKQAKRPEAGMLDIETCGYVSKLVIQTSIKSCYRTWEDWERFFAGQNAAQNGNLGEWALQEVKETEGVNTPQSDNDAPAATVGRLKAKDLPLCDYLNCENKEAVIGVLREFIISQNSAVGQAISYYALTQLEMLTVKSDKEFSIGIVKEFGDIPTLKGESAIRQAISQLRREQYITVNQKTRSGRLLDSDEYAPVLRRLKAEIKAVLTADKQQ